MHGAFKEGVNEGPYFSKREEIQCSKMKMKSWSLDQIGDHCERRFHGVQDCTSCRRLSDKQEIG